jgi:hypothetical protein
MSACWLSSTTGAETLPHEAYIWQRAWNLAVRDAITNAAPSLAGFCTLAAEVAWDQGKPRVVRVPVDWPALQRTGKPYGVALRVGGYTGPFDRPREFLTQLAGTLVADAGQPAELQIDFDSVTSRLTDYRGWVEAIRQRVAPVPVTVTTLPSWMESPAFATLVKAADGFVLQVHSLERPTASDAPLTVCDAAAARRRVEQAAKLGVPFRVALPTYGYLVAFDARGKFIGLSAEGPIRSWPASATLRTVRADAAGMARLVQHWTAARPANMRGVIWYRLPTAEDTLNWRWQTLAAVIAGRIPEAKLVGQAQRTQPGLVEIELANTGEADAALPATVTATWRDARLVAADALGGYERLDTGARKFILRAKPSLTLQRLAPGEGRVIGWLRLSADKEVEIHVAPDL